MIQIGNITTDAGPGKFRLRFGSGTAHAFNLQYVALVGAAYAVDTSAASGNFINLDAGYTTKGLTISVNSPFLTTATTVGGLSQTTTEFYVVNGIETSATSFTAITFSNANAVNFTGGTVKIYGYANS